MIRGLPRSRVDHTPSGLWLNKSNGLLYLTVGGLTNSGAPSTEFHLLPEYALSAAILEIDLAKLPSVPYDLPTLDDEDRPGSEDAGDPFGGNSGKNQAILDDEGPVRLYASGFRNAFRVTGAAGALFTIDNGVNQDSGGPPIWHDGRVTNETATPPSGRLPSVLLRIGDRGYYGGHPNPARADRRNTFNDSHPQSPVAAGRPEEAYFLPPGRKPGALMQFNRSVNGIATYHSSAFGEDWRESLLIAGWDRIFRLVRVSQEGDLVAEKLLVRQGGFLPLDVTSQHDSDPFPGSIWAADYAANGVTVIEPVRESGLLALPAAISRDLLVWGTERALEWTQN